MFVIKNNFFLKKSEKDCGAVVLSLVVELERTIRRFSENYCRQSWKLKPKKKKREAPPLPHSPSI